MYEAYQGEDSTDEGFSAMVLAGLQMPGIICRYERLLSKMDIPQVPGIQGTPTQRSVNCSSLLVDICEARRRLLALRERHQLEPQKLSMPRIQHASWMSINAFSAMIDYMHVNLITTGFGFKVASPGDLSLVSGEDFGAMELQFQGFVSIVKSELEALRLIDDIAAAQSIRLLHMMACRVLEAPCSRETTSNCLRPILDDLVNHLSGGG